MYSDIKEQFRRVIIHSQNIPDPQIDELFDEWQSSKQRFIDLFGGLIYEWPEPVEFSLDPKEKINKAMEFSNCIYNSFNNPALAEFLDANLDTFFDNKVSKTIGKVPEGIKLIKAFKFFEDDKATLRNIQDMASQIIQENKVKGILCFSVHPLDFLSSSENTYNWRSCHALDGEYRAGNLSYMVDKTTFMVYLKGADDVIIPLFGDVKWNSKKWRMLIYLAENEEIMFAGRQYPFNSRSGMDMVLNIYNNLFQSSTYRYSKYGEWRADYVNGFVPYDADPLDTQIELNHSYMVFGGDLAPLDKVVQEGCGALNYNDVLRSTCYTFPYYSILNPWGFHRAETLLENPVIIGGKVSCLHCGRERITNSETMRCSDCELEFGYEENDVYGSCACCGTRIYNDDAIFVSGCEELICDGCYHSLCFVCDSCGEVYYKDDRHFITTGEDGASWYCSHCYNDYIDEKRRDY